MVECATTTHMTWDRGAPILTPPLGATRVVDSDRSLTRVIHTHTTWSPTQKVVAPCLPVMFSHFSRFSVTRFVQPFKAPMSPDGQVVGYLGIFECSAEATQPHHTCHMKANFILGEVDRRDGLKALDDVRRSFLYGFTRG